MVTKTHPEKPKSRHDIFWDHHTVCVTVRTNIRYLPLWWGANDWLRVSPSFHTSFGEWVKRFALSCPKRESLSFTSTIWGRWQSVTIWFGYLDVIAVYLLLIYWVIFVTYVKWWSNLKTSFHIEYIQKNWYIEESCLFWGETNVTRLRLNLCSSHFAPDFPPIFPT